MRTVVELLANDDWHVRQTALKAIAKLAGIGESSSYSFRFVSNPPQVDCRGQIWKTVLSWLQDKDSDVRQAALGAISQLVVDGLSINSIFMCATNPLQGKCRDEIVTAVQTIVGLFADEQWRIRETALNAIAVLATVRESFCYSFTRVS